jgi:hypothetical protein
LRAALRTREARDVRLGQPDLARYLGGVGGKGFTSVSAPREPVATEGSCATARIPEAPAAASGDSFVSVSHDALFETSEATRCDACNALLVTVDDSDGYGIEGRAVYLWQRAGEAHLESAPLCPSCAAAVGLTALARWEIEEEEG